MKTEKTCRELKDLLNQMSEADLDKRILVMQGPSCYVVSQLFIVNQDNTPSKELDLDDMEELDLEDIDPGRLIINIGW